VNRQNSIVVPLGIPCRVANRFFSIGQRLGISAPTTRLPVLVFTVVVAAASQSMAGVLYEADLGPDRIYAFNAAGQRTAVASFVGGAWGLAFNSGRLYYSQSAFA
jgi:hypothetical protein